jgi:hypothetical protein
MQDVITLGKRLVPVEQIVFVEPFDPASNPEFKTEKLFKARVTLLNRESVLAEITPQEFAEAHGLRMLTDDNIAVNPAIAFRVETFAPTETFKPEKAYVTRLKWRDLEGIEQSKLLLTPPESFIALVWRGEEPAAGRKGSQKRGRPRAPRRSLRKAELARG